MSHSDVVRFLLSQLVVIVMLTSILGVPVARAFSLGDAPKYLARPWCLWECCNRNIWINHTNSTGLHQVLRRQLYGQHLVTNHIISAVESHLTDDDPEKPLVLSFHGRTGTGKNYVARMIAESIYKEGMKSKFVHMFSANTHFPHKQELQQYKDWLRLNIVSNVAGCPYQLFIFDEIEDMPQGLLDSIKPFLDYNVYHDGAPYRGVDTRKAIYIFLSNVAGVNITSKTAEHLKSGGSREDITLKEMEEIIETTALGNAGGGFTHSRLLDNYVISHFVPFLPLERSHVRSCIRTALRKRSHKRSVNGATVDNVLAHLQFTPKDSELFALKGCKNVAEKVALVLHKERKEL